MELRSGSLHIHILPLITDAQQGISTSQIKQYEEFVEAFITEAVWTSGVLLEKLWYKGSFLFNLYRLIHRFVKMIVMEYCCLVFLRRVEGKRGGGKYKIFRLSFFIVMRISQRADVLGRGQDADGHKSPVTYVDDNMNWIFPQFRSTRCFFFPQQMGYEDDSHSGLYVLQSATYEAVLTDTWKNKMEIYWRRANQLSNKPFQNRGEHTATIIRMSHLRRLQH